MKGYTQTLIQPKRGQDRSEKHGNSEDQEILSESPGRRKDKPPLPRDRPPAPPPEASKPEPVPELRPQLPLPGKHGVVPLPSPTNEPVSGNSFQSISLHDRPQLPIPQIKNPREKNKNDKAKNVTESLSNENHLPQQRTGSISLNELSRGLGALKSVKVPSSPVDKVDHTNRHVNRQYEKESENQSDVHQYKLDKPVPKRPVVPKPSYVTRNQRHAVIVDDEILDLREEKCTVKEVEQRPIPAPRKTVRKPNGPAVNTQQAYQRKPLPPPKKPGIGEHKPYGNRPVLSEKTPQLSKVVKKPKIKQVVINTTALKSDILPVAEELQNLYRTACDIITLTEARVSDNIKSKSEDCSSIASSLLDCLSAYRDSLGPVARMKVNNHITRLEECNNELKSLSSELPSSPNAVDLSRLGKVITGVVDVIETLSNYLPSL